MPKGSLRAQRDEDGQKVDTLYAVFVDWNPDIIQEDYTEAETKENNVSYIPFADAIKAAKASNYSKFQLSLPHPVTVNFILGLYEEGYDDHGFLIEGKKGPKAKGKPSKGKATNANVKQASMRIKKKQRQKRRKKQADKGKKKDKKAKDAFNVIFDDESSFSNKSLHSLSYAPFTMSSSLYSAF